MTTAQERQFASAMSWLAVAMTTFGGLMNFTTGAYTQGGIGVAMAAAIVVLRVATRSLEAWFQVRLESTTAMRDENMADAQQSQANAEMAQTALAAMKAHAASGGSFVVEGEIKSAKKMPTH